MSELKPPEINYLAKDYASFRQLLLDGRDQRIDLAVIIDIHQELGIGAVDLFGGLGEHETQPTGAGQCADMRDTLHTQQVRLHRFGRLQRIVDIGSLGQPEIDHELGAGGVWEETLVDVAEAPQGGGEGRVVERTDGAGLLNGPSEQKKFFGQCCLAGIRMADNAEGAPPVDFFLVKFLLFHYQKVYSFIRLLL